VSEGEETWERNGFRSFQDAEIQHHKGSKEIAEGAQPREGKNSIGYHQPQPATWMRRKGRQRENAVASKVRGPGGGPQNR